MPDGDTEKLGDFLDKKLDMGAWARTGGNPMEIGFETRSEVVPEEVEAAVQEAGGELMTFQVKEK